MKFTFIAERTIGIANGAKCTTEFNAEVLPDILGEFENFLRGLGFLIDGHLDIVNDDD